MTDPPAPCTTDRPVDWALAVQVATNGTLIFVDPAWEAAWPHGACRPGQPLVDLFEPDDRPAVSELVDALASRRLAGGAVSARLAGGAGATVSLERTGEASVLAGLVAWSSAVVPSPTRPPRPHVLLVEDHPVNRVVAGAT